MVRLINKGHGIEAVLAIIKSTYGENTSPSKITRMIVADKKRYEQDGRLHPNFC